jgi:vacuolar-type H+-ATPase subunit F/Vma7
VSADRSGPVVAIGETHELQGFVLVGVHVHHAVTTAEVVTAWEHATEAGLVILTPRAAELLGGRRAERPELLTVVMS